MELVKIPSIGIFAINPLKLLNLASFGRMKKP